MTRLAHTAAHEINNPLAAIVAQLDTLVRQRSDDPELVARLQQTLESRERKDLVAGSGLRFEERAAHALKGVPGEWHVYAVDPAA